MMIYSIDIPILIFVDQLPFFTVRDILYAEISDRKFRLNLLVVVAAVKQNSDGAYPYDLNVDDDDYLLFDGSAAWMDMRWLVDGQ